MIESMVEKVARAIWDKGRTFPDCGHRPDFDDLNETARNAYKDLARAAIEAMASAADDEHLLQRINVTAYDGRFSKSGETYPVYRNFIRAFIDAALT